MMNNIELECFAHEAAKAIKTKQGLNDFPQMLTKVTVETVPYAKLDKQVINKAVYLALGVFSESVDP